MHRLYLEKWEPAVYESLFGAPAANDDSEAREPVKPKVTYQRYHQSSFNRFIPSGLFSRFYRYLDHFNKSGLRFGSLQVDTWYLAVVGSCRD
jgi:hypothetical protein